MLKGMKFTPASFHHAGAGDIPTQKPRPKLLNTSTKIPNCQSSPEIPPVDKSMDNSIQKNKVHCDAPMFIISPTQRYVRKDCSKLRINVRKLRTGTGISII